MQNMYHFPRTDLYLMFCRYVLWQLKCKFCNILRKAVVMQALRDKWHVISRSSFHIGWTFFVLVVNCWVQVKVLEKVEVPWLSLSSKSYWNYWVCLVGLYFPFFISFPRIKFCLQGIRRCNRQSHFKCEKVSADFIEKVSITVKRSFSFQEVFSWE